MHNVSLSYLILKSKHGKVFEYYELGVNLPINSALGLKNMIMFFLDEPGPLLRAFINSLLK